MKQHRASNAQGTRRHAGSERFDVIVIGGGQAGLSVGYHLKLSGVRFVILDASARIGDAWRKRWDSLRLFSPAWLSGLDGMRFPGPAGMFPTKDEMADYLEAYAARFALPVRTSTRVDRLARRGAGFVVQAGGQELEADQVVVAMASYQQGRLPAFASELRSDILQLHSSDYANPSQLRPGRVAVVGGGNSGAEIARELRRTHEVVLAGNEVGAVPFRIDSWLGRTLLVGLLMRFVFHRLLTIRTLFGRKARTKMMHGATPLIRTKLGELARAGVQRAARIAGARDGRPMTEDGRVLDVANVIWCTGFAPRASWIDLPIFDDAGDPAHEAGVVTREPGLYFVGLPFMYAMSSAMIHGVGRDARRIAGLVARSAVRARSTHRPDALRAAGLVAMAIAFTGLFACSASSGSPLAISAAPGAALEARAERASACSLVTAAEASAALGSNATNDESKKAGASSRCTYEASTGSAMIIVSDQGKAAFDKAHAAAAARGAHAFAEVGEIGDGAFATFGGPMASVMVLKGTLAVTFILTVSGAAAPPRDKVSAMARASASRI